MVDRGRLHIFGDVLALPRQAALFVGEGMCIVTNMITQSDDYFSKGCGRCARFATTDCSAHIWRAGLLRLRDLCLAAGLTETAKWGQPCYMHADRNIAIFGAFRDDFRLSFFEAGLLTDPAGVLEKQGAHAVVPDMIRFRSADDVTEKAEIISAYLSEAMDFAARGLKAPKIERTIEIPDELVAAMDADPVLAEAFHALTPGRQKSYAFAIGGAKQSATRAKRVEKYRPKILAGKGAQEY